jgi:phosphoesterase RecJ-like protein
MGHEVIALLPEGMPKRYSYLPGLDLIADTIPNQADVIIAVDTADEKRLGVPIDKLPHRIDINIDHHISNAYFGKINIVDVSAAAATQVLYAVLNELGIPITTEIAMNLLTGLVTDTIGFRTENVTSQVMRLVAELQDLGAPLAQIKHEALYQRTYPALRFWGCGLSRLEMDKGVVWTKLKLIDREEVGYAGYDDADLINLLSNIENTSVAVIFIEQPRGKTKVSWRAKSGVNVSSLAETFGGGGHKAASGAMIVGNLDDVMRDVLAATFEMLKLNVEIWE